MLIRKYRKIKKAFYALGVICTMPITVLAIDLLKHELLGYPIDLSPKLMIQIIILFLCCSIFLFQMAWLSDIMLLIDLGFGRLTLKKRRRLKLFIKIFFPVYQLGVFFVLSAGFRADHYLDSVAKGSAPPMGAAVMQKLALFSSNYVLLCACMLSIEFAVLQLILYNLIKSIKTG